MKPRMHAVDLLPGLRMVLWFFVLLFVADFVCASVWQLVETMPVNLRFNANLRTALIVTSWALAFGAAGALLARAVTPTLALPLALTLGLAHHLPAIIDGHFYPWISTSHGATLCFLIASWANWYAPVLASVAGALAWTRYRGQ